MSDVPPLRAGDADRDAAMDRLRDALAEGRLDHAEFGDRVERASAARTLTELAELTADLPSAGSLPAPVPLRDLAVPARSELASRSEALAPIVSMLSVFALCNVIWLVTGGAYWWPGWLLIPLAASVLKAFQR